MTILFIPLDERPPGPVQRGATMLRMLRQRYRVIGLERVPNFGTTSRPLQFLRLFWYWLRVFKFSIQHRKEIDVIFCENIHAVIGGMLSKVIGKPCIGDIETEHRLYLKAWERSGLYSWTVQTLFGLAFRLTQLLITTCEEDREGYTGRGHSPTRVVTVPLCIDFALLRCQGEDERGALRRRLGLDPSRIVLVYTGNRTEPPYREGAQWICSELAPALAQVVDNFQILLTGRGKVLPAPTPQVVFTGFVPNILEHLAAADICLAPIWRETGIPGKVIEYMAMGKPVVATSLVRGIPHLQDGENVMVARTKEEFVARVVYLMQHSSQAAAIGARAKEIALAHYSTQRWAPKVWALIESVAITFDRK